MKIIIHGNSLPEIQDVIKRLSVIVGVEDVSKPYDNRHGEDRLRVYVDCNPLIFKCSSCGSNMPSTVNYCMSCGLAKAWSPVNQGVQAGDLEKLGILLDGHS